jgi:two-component system NtrC family sensor kinase
VEGHETGRRCVAPLKKGRLAASIAHEINNPLDSLLNLLYLIKAEANLTAKGHEYLTLAQEEIQRLSEIARETMDKCRHKSALESTNVPQLLDGVITMYKPRLEARGITVEARYCPDGHVPVFPRQLRQVFSNLLLNAADAMPKGGKMHVRVATAHEWTDKERQGLRVTVADNGCGIPSDILPRILEPFFTTKGFSGSGIGLSLVKDTVRDHGGALRVRSSSKPGRSGSVFAIFLPAA